MIPAQTHVRFHLLEPVSSSANRTGDAFRFALLEPITVDGRIVAPAGALGSGTVLLAGHAGAGGHEGDLTLRLDSVGGADHDEVNFRDQRLSINGRNRKIQSGVLEFVPFAGLGAHFIRGSESKIEPQTPIETVLAQPAFITREAARPH